MLFPQLLQLRAEGRHLGFILKTQLGEFGLRGFLLCLSHRDKIKVTLGVKRVTVATHLNGHRQENALEEFLKLTAVASLTFLSLRLPCRLWLGSLIVNCGLSGVLSRSRSGTIRHYFNIISCDRVW